jgi:hypothetical protein
MPDVIIRDDDARPPLQMTVAYVAALALKAACPCTQLLSRPATGEPLGADLDHVCEDVMMGTVLMWAKLQQLEQPWLSASGDLVLRWPPVHGYRRLMLVLQEWALEPENASITRRIDDDAAWQALVAEIQREPRLLEAVLYAVDSRTGGEAWACFQLHHWLLGRLRAAGLPATPEVLAYLKRAVFGQPSWPAPRRAPRRGVLVTTLVFAKPGLANGVWRLHDGNPLSFTGGPLEDKYKKPVQRQIARLEASHLALLRFSQAPIASRAAVNRANARCEGEPQTLDYMREALSSETIEQVVTGYRAGGELQDVIRQQVKLIAARVGRRRDRAKPRLPRLHGWERKAHVRLHEAVQRVLTQENEDF